MKDSWYQPHIVKWMIMILIEPVTPPYLQIRPCDEDSRSQDKLRCQASSNTSETIGVKVLLSLNYE